MNQVSIRSVRLASLCPHVLISIFLLAKPLASSAEGTLDTISDLLHSRELDTHGHVFQRRAYCGNSFGRSFLEPEPQQSEVLSVDDSEDSGYNAAFGFDINRWLSAEVNLVDLGSATINRVDAGNEQTGIDQISYQILDLSAVVYLLNLNSGFANELTTQGLFCRQSLSLFSRLGFGVMRNEAELNRVDHGRNFESHVTVGLGLEYGFINSLAVRGEYIRFDSDARYVGIGLIARLGENRCSGRTLVASLPDIPPVIQAPAGPSEAEETPDQVVNEPPMIKVTPPDVVMPFDNYFDANMDSLSVDNQEELVRFANEIRDTEQRVYISGHADWIGDSDYNLGLSERRVNAVREFLEAQEIDQSRIEFEGFGELMPIDSNETASGRAKNRRVEIRLR